MFFLGTVDAWNGVRKVGLGWVAESRVAESRPGDPCGDGVVKGLASC